MLGERNSSCARNIKLVFTQILNNPDNIPDFDSSVETSTAGCQFMTSLTYGVPCLRRHLP